MQDSIFKWITFSDYVTYAFVQENAGIDDGLPPLHHNRIPSGGKVARKGQSAIGSAICSRMYTDMEAQIHHLEQEAYSAVLRAFKAQSDAISWDKESLITELRKELRVSDDEHRELLTKVNKDDIIQRIREWRKAGEQQAVRFSASQSIHDVVPSPTVSASRKKQKTSLVSQPLHGSIMKTMQYPTTGPAGNRQFTNRSEPAEPTTYHPLIGRKVWTRWPDDNNFYEAVINDYNPAEGLHALVYDIHTVNETWEWVDLKQMPSDDIRWDGEDPGLSHHVSYGGSGPGIGKSMSHGGFIASAGRGRGPMKGPSRGEFPSTQNGVAKRVSDDIELLNTESLVKEVEKVFGLSYPDPLELEKAKKMLKEHEQALVDAIARLADASDGESDGELQFFHGQAMEQE